MAMLTVAARLFRNLAHAEISTSQQVHAGCGQLAGGLAALALPVALLASRTSTSGAETYVGQR
jgi:manganese transport protein